MKQEKIYLKDYKGPAFSVDSVHLDFNLNEDFCRVRAKSAIKQLTAGSALHLNGVDLKLIAVKINGQELQPTEYQVTAEELIIPSVPASFTLEIETQLEPQNNTSLEGLYKSSGIFCTQCEAQGFRKITYFFDRPDVMTSYSVTIEADKKKYPVLLSNGDRIKTEDLGNGRHKAYWSDPHKKPCYLFALVAGDLGVIRDTFTTTSGRKVNLEVYASHGKQDRCWHAMDSLKKAMTWDQDVYGLEYDLNDYMIVAIDDFNAGAMENKGLNIFNSRLVLADSSSATDTDFHSIESVVAHEYFHNWTGNRVTVANWFQLSLKEGLTVFRDQEFSADMTERAVQRIEDVDALRAGQFAEDAGPNAHPVRPESCMAVDNFFTMTIYEKGSELIRMMQTIVGRKGFRKGMDEYFRRHDGQAVTTEDFAAAISEPNGKDFSQFKRWYNQSGTPVVSVLEKFDAAAGEYHLTLEQSCPPTPNQPTKEPFHVPLMMGLLDKNGKELALNCEHITQNTDGKHLIELKDHKKTFVFKGIKERPVLSILREFSAPVNLHWEASEDDLYFLMEKDTDSFNRREMAQKMGLRVLSNLIAKARKGEALQVDEKYINALSAVIRDPNIDPSFKAKMLQLPSYAVLAQVEPVLDAEAFHKARVTVRKTIAKMNKAALLETYRQFHGVEPKSRDTKVFGHRQLKNQALSYLAELQDPEILEIVNKQYWDAQNMTDRMTALTILADSQSEYREKALQHFHDEWKNDSVVINKWFTAQASATSRPDVLKDVMALTQHPTFNLQNPNNVYSLLRAFSANIVRFNDPKLNVYEAYADKILEVDAKNPQVAARLCSAFNFVQKLDPVMKDKALTQIKRMVAAPNLSKNSRELLQSALTT
ncbi:aminopeptidase N [Bdellovibrio svalbardensis]|uniref:Aminopeptidase N n=1 Tax=Bdellovibrio svalbardensis TaxID=2972972 RepID=A0ABT6DJH1_9BACT|nr:aminopeptidase N [Bdellovibrio svalbardensis]MDG0816064.1 aminopeptidase N [Bdellovibrio svalbardensis]